MTSIAEQIARRYATYFEHPSEVGAVLMGLYDATESVDVADLHVGPEDSLSACSPLVLERADRSDAPVCWVHSVDCEIAQDPDALGAWSRQITDHMADRGGKRLVLVTGEVTTRTVLARVEHP